MKLADIAPRLAQARDGRVRHEVERVARKQARMVEARERKRERQEATATTFCGKTQYPSEGEAVKGKRRVRGVKDLRVYKCGVCGYWHLTSKEHVRWAKPWAENA
jgi:rubrerythrin